MSEPGGQANGTGGKPRYRGHEVLRVQRKRILIDDYATSIWYAVLLDDNGHEAPVAISVREADHFGARVPTVDVAA